MKSAADAVIRCIARDVTQSTASCAVDTTAARASGSATVREDMTATPAAPATAVGVATTTDGKAACIDCRPAATPLEITAPVLTAVELSADAPSVVRADSKAAADIVFLLRDAALSPVLTEIAAAADAVAAERVDDVVPMAEWTSDARFDVLDATSDAKTDRF